MGQTMLLARLVHYTNAMDTEIQSDRIIRLISYELSYILPQIFIITVDETNTSMRSDHNG